MDLGLPSQMEESLHFSQPAVTPYTPAHFTDPSVPDIGISLAPYLLSKVIDLTAPVTQDTLTSMMHTKHHNINVRTLIESPSTNLYHRPGFPSIKPSHPPFFPSFPGETESSGGQWEFHGSLPAPGKVSLTDMISVVYCGENDPNHVLKSESCQIMNYVKVFKLAIIIKLLFLWLETKLALFRAMLFITISIAIK